MSETPDLDKGPYGEQPRHNPYQPQQPPGPHGGYGASPSGVPWGPPPDHPQATTVLILGILSFAVCQVLAPFAWVMGKRALREIDASGGRYGGRGQVQAGYVLGIVGSVLLVLGVLLALAYLAIAITALSSST